MLFCSEGIIAQNECQKYSDQNLAPIFMSASPTPPSHFDHPEKKTYTPDWLLPTKDLFLQEKDTVNSDDTESSVEKGTELF